MISLFQIDTVKNHLSQKNTNYWNAFPKLRKLGFLIFDKCVMCRKVNIINIGKRQFYMFKCLRFILHFISVCSILVRSLSELICVCMHYCFICQRMIIRSVECIELIVNHLQFIANQFHAKLRVAHSQGMPGTFSPPPASKKITS